MRVLVVGGANSGKSAFAEQLCCELSARRTYVATMSPDGAEAQERIRRHRTLRADKGFETVECAGALPVAPTSAAAAGGVALVEDVGNLVANALFGEDGSMAPPDQVLDALWHDLDRLCSEYAHAVVVGNDAGCDLPSPYEGTEAWVRTSGALCCRVAAASDVVVEVVCGIPCVIKGRLP